MRKQGLIFILALLLTVLSLSSCSFLSSRADASAAKAAIQLAQAASALKAVYGISAAEPAAIRASAFFGWPSFKWEAIRAPELYIDAVGSFSFRASSPPATAALSEDFPCHYERTAHELKAIELNALWCFLRYAAGLANKARMAFLGGQAREGLFLYGAMTRLYHELGEKRGMTVAMARIISENGGLISGTWPEGAAERRMADWLSALKQTLGENAGAKALDYLLSAPEVKPLNRTERATLTGVAFSFRDELPTLFSPPRDDPRCLAFLPKLMWDVDILDGLLKDGAALNQILAMTDEAELAVYLSTLAYRY